jgi:hypothetical protein
MELGGNDAEIAEPTREERVGHFAWAAHDQFFSREPHLSRLSEFRVARSACGALRVLSFVLNKKFVLQVCIHLRKYSLIAFTG